MPAADPARPDFEALLRGVSRSFFLSIRLLPAALRRPVGLAYLLARATDTVADTAELPVADRTLLLSTLAGAIDGDPAAASEAARLLPGFAARQSDDDERRLMQALPACLAELETVGEADRADIRAVLRHITRGQVLDVARFGAGGGVRALATAEELETYTYLVAGSVGEFWTDLCERHLSPFADLPAGEMRGLGRTYGSALQLINVLRDAGSDLAHGRCYFPAEELAAAGLSPDEVAARPERLAPVWLHWHGRAFTDLASGMSYANALGHRRVRAASALPALLGIRTLVLLRQAGPGALTRPVKVPRAEVRWLLLRLALTGAARGGLQSAYGRMAGEALASGWENPPR